MKPEKILRLSWRGLSRKPDFLFIKKLSKQFPDIHIYLVGGAVRDILLKREGIIDYDFVVRNISQKKLSSFLNKLGRVNFVGKNFGVFKFIPKKHTVGEEIDIALPRTEESINRSGKHRDFKIISRPHIHIETDLARRDFSINALAFDVIHFNLIDPFGGIADLKKKRINTVGIPRRRFSEDLIRILRAIRFSIQLDFTLEKKVLNEIKKLAPQLNETQSNGEWLVPRESIAKELVSSYISDPVHAFEVFDTTNITKHLMPELLKMKGCPQPKQFHTEGDVWKHTKLALSKIYSPLFKKYFPGISPSPLLIFATLFHDVAKPLTLQTPKKHGADRIRFNGHDRLGGKVSSKIAKRLKLSSVKHADLNIEDLSWIIANHLLLVTGDVNEIKNSTLEKYFFNNSVPGDVLQQLFFIDGAATLPSSGKPNLLHLRKLLKRLEKLEKIISKRPRSSLLNGKDIMKKCRLKEGPQIGVLLSELREAELAGVIATKTQALTFVQKKLK